MDPELLFELLKTRRSTRKFTEEPVPRESILKLIEAARWAPSNHNRQGWKFLVYDNRQEIRSLALRVEEALGRKIEKLPSLATAYAAGLVRYATLFSEAPALVVVLHKKPTAISAPMLEDIPHPMLASGEVLSAAMAAQNLLLTAHAIGLGACILTGPLMAPEGLEALPVPPGFEITCLVALGYPAETPNAPRRKELEQIVEFINPAQE
jgi:nitroreductase